MVAAADPAKPRERRDFADAALWVLVPVGLLVVLLTVLLHAVNAPTWFWNGARLAPTIALAPGLRAVPTGR